MSNTEKYGGKPFTVADRTYLCAPLSIGAMKRFSKAITDATTGKLTREETFDTMLTTIVSSLQRNYPDLSRDEIEENIVDMANMGDFFRTVLDASGFAAAPKAGKDQAGSPAQAASTA